MGTMGENKREITKKTILALISFSLSMDRYRNMDVCIKPNLYACLYQGACIHIHKYLMYLVIYHTSRFLFLSFVFMYLCCNFLLHLVFSNFLIILMGKKDVTDVFFLPCLSVSSYIFLFLQLLNTLEYFAFKNIFIRIFQ